MIENSNSILFTDEKETLNILDPITEEIKCITYEKISEYTLFTDGKILVRLSEELLYVVINQEGDSIYKLRVSNGKFVIPLDRNRVFISGYLGNYVIVDYRDGYIQTSQTFTYNDSDMVNDVQRYNASILVARNNEYLYILNIDTGKVDQMGCDKRFQSYRMNVYRNMILLLNDNVMVRYLVSRKTTMLTTTVKDAKSIEVVNTIDEDKIILVTDFTTIAIYSISANSVISEHKVSFFNTIKYDYVNRIIILNISDRLELYKVDADYKIVQYRSITIPLFKTGVFKLINYKYSHSKQTIKDLLNKNVSSYCNNNIISIISASI